MHLVAFCAYNVTACVDCYGLPDDFLTGGQNANHLHLNFLQRSIVILQSSSEKRKVNDLAAKPLSEKFNY